MGIKKSKPGRPSAYDQGFRSAVCHEVLSGKLSYAEARRVYAIKGRGTIRFWVEQYQQDCNLPSMTTEDNPIDNAAANMQPANNEALQKKTKELEEALKRAQLKITVLETMIDIAESELNIDIRKKPGTKQ